jgi:hypothetical protein
MKLFFTLMGLLALSASMGQQILSLDEYLSPAKLQAAPLGNQPYEDPQKARLKQMIFDLQPNITLSHQRVYHHYSASEETPLVMYATVDELPAIASVAAEKRGIEILTIKVRTAADLQSPLPANLNTALPGLRFVFLDSYVDLAPDAIKKIIPANLLQVVFLYRVSTPS